MRTMIDHPGWEPQDQECRRVLSDDNGGRWLVSLGNRSRMVERLRGTAAEPEPTNVLMPAVGVPVAHEVPDLFWKLDDLSPVARFANPSLWDALATAIVRQVVRAETATQLYHRFSNTYGDAISVGALSFSAFPTAEVVLGLSDEQFAQAGMTFKREPLRSAAEAFCKYGDAWQTEPTARLVEQLQTVPRIGPWTAGAAVADWSNDFGVYPYADLAVRTWARRAAPSFSWPDKEPAFADEWTRLAGDHLSELTMLTLAWGKHHGEDTP